MGLGPSLGSRSRTTAGSGKASAACLAERANARARLRFRKRAEGKQCTVKLEASLESATPKNRGELQGVLREPCRRKWRRRAQFVPASRCNAFEKHCKRVQLARASSSVQVRRHHSILRFLEHIGRLVAGAFRGRRALVSVRTLQSARAAARAAGHRGAR
eukprot:230692-Pleurochrysis_carterae.AAC.4